MINGNRTKSNRGRSRRDFYKTPIALAEKAVEQLRYDEELGYYSGVDALDAGCGDGVWGKAGRCLWWASDEENFDPDIDGIDIHPEVKSWSEYYNNVYYDDFITHDFNNNSYDLVFGNPPFSLAEEFVKKAFTIIDDNGYVYFLFRLSFLEGIDRGKNFWPVYPLKTLYVCSRRPSFFSSGTKHSTDTLAYAMFLWQKGYKEDPVIKFLDWSY